MNALVINCFGTLGKRFLLLGVIILLLFLFCPSIYADEQVKFVWEIKAGLSRPVDVAISGTGDVYALDQENSAVYIYDNKGDFKKYFGKRGKENGEFETPLSVAVTGQGRIIVSDTGNNRIQVFDRSGQFLFRFGSGGSERGQFKEPCGLTTDQFGFIYVADKGNRRVQIFSPNGIFFDSIDVQSQPVDVGIDPQRNIYVLLDDAGNVVKYSPEGKKLQEIKCVIGKQNYIPKAAGLAVDNRGDIFVTETMHNSIKKFDRNENVLISFGSLGDGRGQFDSAIGLAVDAKNHLFVADSKNARVQVFEVTGSKKTDIPPVYVSPLVLDFDGTVNAKNSIVDLCAISGRGIYYLSQEPKDITIDGRVKDSFGSQGEKDGEFMRPMAMDVTLDGGIFVADTGNARIQILTPKGKYSYGFGKPGNIASRFNNPQGIAVNSKGEIYVSDTNNHRLQIFNYDGIYLSSIGPGIPGSVGPDGREMELRYPMALVVGKEDEVYVIDSGNERIVVLGADGRLKRVIGRKGSSPGQFDNPVDIALDLNGRLYVADKGNYRVQIFDKQGNFIRSFGSRGEGGGYFREISAIAVSEGKIYVADYKSDLIQIFRYIVSSQERNARVYSTKAASPERIKGNAVTRFALAKEQARKEAVSEFTSYLKVGKERLERLIRTESVEVLNDGRVKVTVSLPKKIPKEALRPLNQEKNKKN